MILTYVTGEQEWDALYIDGGLVRERSSIPTREALELIADHKEPIELWTAVAPTDFLNENGYPADLADCQFLKGYEPKRYEAKR